MPGPQAIETAVDETSGLVTITGRGLFGEPELKAHFVELARILRDRRRSRSPIRVIVDLRSATVQRIGAADAIAEHNHRAYAPQDRLAIVTTSAIYALQMKRSHSDERFGVFSSWQEGLDFLRG